MNIVLLPAPSFKEIGGVATHVFMLARGLEKLGHHVFLINEYPPKWFRWPFVRFPEWLLSKFNICVARQYRRIAEDLYFFIELLWKTKGVVHVLNIQNVQHAEIVKWLRCLRRCQAVLTVHGYLTYEAESRGWCTVGDQTHQWLLTLERKGYAEFDAIVCVGRQAVRHVQQFVSKPVAVIPNGLDTNLFCAAPKVTREKICILFAGVLQPAKGIMDALEATRLLIQKHKAAVELRVAGKGAQAEEAKAYVVAHGLEKSVVFLGALQKEEMPAFYRSGDILLFPSKQGGVSGKSEESSPYAVLEAMASGLPIVAYRTQALEDHVQEGRTGFLVAPGDCYALADRLGELCRNTSMLQDMGKAARLHCEQHHSQIKMAQRYLEIYTSFLQ
ncbi:glycosyltransferase family 4 protein [Anaeromusa sp.]|uniref:glycosyltransferase family 4 protein n=1 Tax=Anaeromusa sp. TaxID=1872520 RepID=UPI002623AA4A|nr:glycosyltransferase family 4 protein [Anaeromusa sp.]MDD3158702.1 glycosyltransferase family 4 protein [Anaeromusa sp.]